MTEQDPSQDRQTSALKPVLWLLVFAVIFAIALFSLNKALEPEPVTLVKVKPEPLAPPSVPAAAPEKKPVDKPVTKQVAKTKTPPPAPKPPAFNGFIIEGDLSTGGEPWAANNIVVRMLWLKNKEEEFKLGHETARLKLNDTGLRYRLRLKHQPRQYINWNNGVEGNIGRIIAYVDLERDGRLSIEKDRIIAVSKELVRYRTGRYDANILNETQQENIRNEGKGYAIIQQVMLDEEKSDWQVAHRISPAPVDLSAKETQLPGLYTTLIKLQVK